MTILPSIIPINDISSFRDSFQIPFPANWKITSLKNNLTEIINSYDKLNYTIPKPLFSQFAHKIILRIQS